MAFNFNKFRDDEANTVGTKANLEKLAGEIADMNYTDFTEGEDYASLAKRYSTQGQKAMDDTVGQVAARTGGIASSYAAAAGNQAYNDYMGKLEDAARAMYDDQRQEKVDNLGISKTLYDQGYQEKMDDRAWRQWREEFNASNDQWNKQYENTIKNQKLQEAQVIWSTGGTLSDKQLEDLGIDRATEAAYMTVYGPQVTEYKYGYEDEDKNAVYYDNNGNAVVFDKGVNPYSGTVNPDTANGAMDNGYQPNNVQGVPVTRLTQDVYFDDGSSAPAYKLGENSGYVYWDESSNSYVQIDNDTARKYGLTD